MHPLCQGTENWKPVPKYENLYWISDMGRVSSSSRILKLHVRSRKKKHLQVELWKDGKRKKFYVHSLVMATFGSDKPHPDKTQIRHLDGDASNNRIENLEWGNQSDNEQDKRRHGTYYTRGGRRT